MNSFVSKILVLTTIFFLLFNKIDAFAQCGGKNDVFQSGEKLYFDGYYNLAFIWLNAGYVTFSVENIFKNKEKLFKISAIGGSHKGYDKIFKIRDTIEVIVDPITVQPIEYKQITLEGTYTAEHYYQFDKTKRKVNMRIRRDKSQWEIKTIDWPQCSFDVLSMAYAARTIDFSKYKVNDKIPMNLIVDGEHQALYIRYKGVEIIQNKDGKYYRCLKFSPLLLEGTIFNKGEDMTVWVTDDKARVPIIVEAKILIGAVKAIFIGADGLKNPIEAEINFE
ncbi:MAG: DUF3108 domain-containing protein [Marinilabiliaceae bacterium]|nr:DUF3108 domain-containing protein [Marinilabiliaceae bacterium]